MTVVATGSESEAKARKEELADAKAALVAAAEEKLLGLYRQRERNGSWWREAAPAFQILK
jgi:hypothetical protein